MNPFKTAILKEHNGRVFVLHWKNRFDPVTLAVVAISAGAGMSAYGQYQAGEAAMDAAEYDAKIKEREAKAQEQRTRVEQSRAADAAARRMSSLEAGLNASGAVSTAGAPLEILGQQEAEYALDNLMIGYEGNTEQQRLRSEAKQIKYAGKTARYSSRIGAGSSLLSGFGMAAAMGGGAGKGAGMGKGGGWAGGNSSAGFGSTPTTGGGFYA